MWKKIKSVLRLGSHYKIERFGVLLTTLVILMTFLMISIGVKVSQDNSMLLSNVAKYSDKFNFSLSGAKGEVVDVYRDDNFTKAFVLLKLSQESINILPMDANDYTIYLTAVNPNGSGKTITSNPAVSFYKLGYSGYMGIYLVDTEGFNEEILELTMRSNKTLGRTENDNTKAIDDGSFRTHDQARIYFNPGGNDAKVVDFLNSDEVINIFDIYSQTISLPLEEEYEATLMATLEEMKLSLNRIESYENDVKRNGVILPDKPVQIANDSIEEVKDEDGNITEYVYNTDYIPSRGVNLDWQNNTVINGYVENVIDTNESIRDYIRRLEKQKPEPNLSLGLNNVRERLNIRDENGRDVEYTDSYISSEEGAGDAQAKSVNILLKEYANYFSLKTRYHSKEQLPILKLDRDIRDVQRDYTANTSDELLIIY